jgi:hypothetical protein
MRRHFSSVRVLGAVGGLAMMFMCSPVGVNGGDCTSDCADPNDVCSQADSGTCPGCAGSVGGNANGAPCGSGTRHYYSPLTRGTIPGGINVFLAGVNCYIAYPCNSATPMNLSYCNVFGICWADNVFTDQCWYCASGTGVVYTYYTCTRMGCGEG